MDNLPLSVCIIVNDYAKYLSNTLESIKDIAAEIIIINSPPGPLSTLNLSDKTTDQLREKKEGEEEKDISSSPPLLAVRSREGDLGGEFKHYEFPNNDLAAARNFAVAKASQPWILTFDSDYILSVNRDELIKCLNQTDISLFYIKFIENELTIEQQKKLRFKFMMPPEFDIQFSKDISDKGSKSSDSPVVSPALEGTGINLKGFLFRNGQNIQFKGKVFETLVNIDNLKSEVAEVFLYHYQYNQEARENILKSTRNLLLAALAEEKDNSERLFYQAKLLALNPDINPEIKNKIVDLHRVIKSANIDHIRFEQWYYDITAFLLNKNDLNLGLDILIEALDMFPTSIALLFNFYHLLFKMAKIFECIQLLKYIIFQVKNNSEETLRHTLHNDLVIPVKLLNEDYLNQQLALCYHEINDNYSALYYFKLIRNLSKYESDFNEVQYSINSTEFVLKFLEKQLETENNFTLVSFRLAREYVREQKIPEALSAYSKALKKAEAEEDEIFLKLIYSDLLFYGKVLSLSIGQIEQIEEQGKTLTKNFSGFWYSLGKYYLSVARPVKALAAFQRALQIEEELERNISRLPLQVGKGLPFIDILLTGVNDYLIKAKTLKEINFAGQVITTLAMNNDFIKAEQHWQKKDFAKAIEYFLLIEPENDYDMYVINDYLALGNERLVDFEKALDFIRRSITVYNDDSLLFREIVSKNKKYTQIVNSVPDNFTLLKSSPEWRDTLKIIDSINPQIILEIGPLRAGTFYSFTQLVSKGIIISIEAPGIEKGLSDAETDHLKSQIIENNHDNEIYFIKNLPVEEALKKVKDILKDKQSDVLFLNGEHSYNGIKQEFEVLAQMVSGTGLIIVNDIHSLKNAPADEFLNNSGVEQFWREISLLYRTKEIIFDRRQKGHGVGIIYNHDSGSDYYLEAERLLKEKNPQYFAVLKKLLTDTMHGESTSDLFISGKISYSKIITMINTKRLNNIQFCLEEVIKNNIPGDILEAGVWRGGAVIFIRAVLKFYNIENKKVFAADSFEGLPEPDKDYPVDRDAYFHELSYLAVGLDEVKRNFQKFNMLDEQVVFLKGWFKDSFKDPPFEKLAVLRLDGDMYSSTWETLTLLYDKVSPGGYIIVDDYALSGCKAAIDQFRSTRNIIQPLEKVDNSCVYWQKPFVDLKLFKNDTIFINPQVNPKKKIFDRFNLVSQDINPGFYQDNILLFSLCFDELGIEFKTSYKELSGEHCNILFQPTATPEFCEYARGFSYIPFQMEQLVLPMLNSVVKPDYLKLLKNADFIWDYNQANINYLNSLGINNALYLPLGFHEKMHILDFDKEKELDILFYGSLTRRRIDILNTLSKKGFKTKALSDVFGRERNSYIEKAKIIINIHHYKDALLEEHRLSFLLNNHCFVISESVEQPFAEYYKTGVSFCAYDELVETCEFYLKPEKEFSRKQIAEKGYNEFSKNKMTENLKRVMGEG
jgi:O-methyltransferase